MKDETQGEEVDISLAPLSPEQREELKDVELAVNEPDGTQRLRVLNEAMLYVLRNDSNPTKRVELIRQLEISRTSFREVK